MRLKQKLIRTACLRRLSKPFVYTRPGICFYGSVGGREEGGGGACIHSSSTPFHVSRSLTYDTLEYQQTEKIETEVKDVDRIRAYRCTQHCSEEVCIDPFIIC